MFHSTATVTAQIGPVRTDWTIQELLDWIASEDMRAHDETLRPLLTALVAGLAPGAPSAATPRSPIALVRSVVMSVRATPALRGVPLAEVPGVAAALDTAAVPGMPERRVADEPEASLRAPLPQFG